MSADPMPAAMLPMLAKLARAIPQNGDGYGLEFRWDGLRMMAFVERGSARFTSRGQKDYTPHLPALASLGSVLQGHTAILDGEVVGVLPGGGVTFGALHEVLGPGGIATSSGAKLFFMVFDLLHWDGVSLLHVPYQERRARLEALELAGPNWDVPPAVIGGAAGALQAESRRLGLEGVVAKRLEGAYEPGRRSGSWLKVKNTLCQDLVIVGWVEGQGSRAGTIGSLLLGYHEGGELVLCGKVGSGFDRRTLVDLLDRLRSLEVDVPAGPWERSVPGARWVRPELVCEVEFAEWFDRQLRHPSFKGLVEGRLAETVVRLAP